MYNFMLRTGLDPPLLDTSNFRSLTSIIAFGTYIIWKKKLIYKQIFQDDVG